MFPGAWVQLRLYALEAHDLALSKLELNFDKDRDDIKHLALFGHIKPDVMRERYYKEARPNLLSREKEHDATQNANLKQMYVTGVAEVIPAFALPIVALGKSN